MIRKSSYIFYDIENYFSIHRLLNYIGKINVSKYNYSEIAYNLEELKKNKYFKSTDVNTKR